MCRLAPLVAMFVLLVGCSDRGGSTAGRVEPGVSQGADQEELGRKLLTSASDMLNDLDNFDEGTLENALKQVVRRLNEGLATLPASRGDRPAPLTIEDGHVLREIVWLRDTARFAVGDETDPLRRAERIFDWTTRNIQLIPADAPQAKVPLLPWHILMFGRANELDRAWLFQLLARQQQLDVVLLAYPDAAPDAKPQNMKRWCAALLHDKQLYLFDARIGAPIRAKDGLRTATLVQAAADDGLLRALDLEGKPYPAKAADIQKMTAIIETSSVYVEPRLARIGQELSGRNKLELSIDPAKLTAELKQSPGIVGVVEWPLRNERYTATRPAEKENFEAIRDMLIPFNLPRIEGRNSVVSPLLKARVRHFSGKYYEHPHESDPALRDLSINRRYQEARHSDEYLKEIEAQRNDFAWDLLYRMKRNATYWLGLVAYDLNNYDTARSYFELVLKEPSSTNWTAGARYNLGRTYEAEADAAKEAARKTELRQKAIATYRGTFLDAPPDDQSLERAKWLERQTAK